jgi:predicted metal-dependent hydrolase
MTKWTKTRPDPGRSYKDEATERTSRMVARMREFLETAVPQDERLFVQAVKEAKPNITVEELKQAITQFRAAVAERQRHDQGLR